MIDLHIHTLYSDGTASVYDVARKAKERGLKVIAVVDHSIEHKRGITEDKLKLRQREIEEAKDTFGIDILSGIECGILPGGEIALPKFDFDLVVVSIHDIMPTEEYYHRILECLRKYKVDVLGHLHSEMFNCGRDYARDVELIDVLLEKGVALEINSHHHAPPIDFLEMCSGKEMVYSIGSDAHTVERVGDVKWCLEMARRFLKKGTPIIDIL